MNRPRVFLFISILLAGALAFGQRAPIPQQLTFTPYRANGIYKIGETVGWTVTPGPAAVTYAYKWEIRRNNAVVLKEGKLDLSTGKDKIEITGDQPEMLYVAIEPYANLDGSVPTATGAAAGASPLSAAPPSSASGSASTAAASSRCCNNRRGSGGSGKRRPGKTCLAMERRQHRAE